MYSNIIVELYVICVSIVAGICVITGGIFVANAGRIIEGVNQEQPCMLAVLGYRQLPPICLPVWAMRVVCRPVPVGRTIPEVRVAIER